MQVNKQMGVTPNSHRLTILTRLIFFFHAVDFQIVRIIGKRVVAFSIQVITIKPHLKKKYDQHKILYMEAQVFIKNKADLNTALEGFFFF